MTKSLDSWEAAADFKKEINKRGFSTVFTICAEPGINPFVTIRAIMHDLKNHKKHMKFEGLGLFRLNEYYRVRIWAKHSII